MHGQDRDDDVGRAGQDERDAVLGADAARDEVAGEPVRAVVQFRVGEGRVAADERDVVRGARGLRLPQVGERPGGRVGGGVVPRGERGPLAVPGEVEGATSRDESSANASRTRRTRARSASTVSRSNTSGRKCSRSDSSSPGATTNDNGKCVAS
ncbi:hypothetical protein BJF79_44725 [Actinomadura sp. CNU-125]|nr:hypothetical protein BJF79_44725 [Actinomadura sp. CNU-125]